MLKVYEGEGKTAAECHFLGEFELSGIPPMPKGQPIIRANFRIDDYGILSVNASCGEIKSSMELDVYSKSGDMTEKTRQKLSSRLNELMSSNSRGQLKCEILENATKMTNIPEKQNTKNVLKLHVNSEVSLINPV